MSAFPDTDTRYGEVLTARGVPREQWRNYHKWVRFYLHFCHKYRHRPADSESLQLFIGKLASKGQTSEQCNKRNVVRYIPPDGWTEFPLMAIFIVTCGSFAW